MKKRKGSDAAPRPSSDASSPALLRVSLSREAWADLVAHAKESLDAEVCGVLVGSVREDDEAVVDVRATIRGTEAREARAHVTFTHETWNQIHSALDRDYPDLQIVGWYHTHPGFGVEFSAMDRFIQENFFSGRAQVAFLSDPLGSDVALVCNRDGGIEYLTSFWVDGREHAATTPGGVAPAQEASNAASAVGATRNLERLEARVNQLVQLLDEQQRNFYRMLVALVVIICLGVISAVGYVIYSDRTNQLKPPQVQSFMPVPIKVGNDTVMLGVGIVKWDVPPQLDALMEKVARYQVEEDARARKELQQLQKQQQKQQTPRKP